MYTIPVSASAESLINSAPVFRFFDCRLSEQSNLPPTGGTYSQQEGELHKHEGEREVGREREGGREVSKPVSKPFPKPVHKLV